MKKPQKETDKRDYNLWVDCTYLNPGETFHFMVLVSTLVIF